MKAIPRIAALAIAISAATSAPAWAHHSRAAFQLDTKTEMRARITSVRWTNPHVFLVGEVVDEQGRKSEWIFECHSISGLSRMGWTKDSVKEGDELLLVVNRHRDPDKHFALLDHAVMPDGRLLYSVGVPQSDPNAPKPPVRPSADFSGNWKYIFPGTPQQVRERILLGPAPPVKDGPYTANARAQVAAYREADNPTLRCIPPTLPYLLMTVYEYKWIRYKDRIVIQKEQFNESTRVIHLDGRARPVNYHPNPLGYSVGRFEPDGTLVVETSGFSPAPWGNGSGIDSSDKKKIVERYRLTNGGLGLSLSYTHEDPEYFTKALSGQGSFQKMPDFNFAQNPPCDLKAAQQHLAYDQ